MAHYRLLYSIILHAFIVLPVRNRASDSLAGEERKPIWGKGNNPVKLEGEKQ